MNESPIDISLINNIVIKKEIELPGEFLTKFSNNPSSLNLHFTFYFRF